MDKTIYINLLKTVIDGVYQWLISIEIFGLTLFSWTLMFMAASFLARWLWHLTGSSMVVSTITQSYKREADKEHAEAEKELKHREYMANKAAARELRNHKGK